MFLIHWIPIQFMQIQWVYLKVLTKVLHGTCSIPLLQKQRCGIKGDHAQEVLITRDSTIRKVQAFAIDPENSKKLYAVISIDKAIGLYVSDDGGLKWDKGKRPGREVLKIFLSTHPLQKITAPYILPEIMV